MNHQNIYDFIQAEEISYMTPINVIDGFSFSMKEHIRLSVLYKNSHYKDGGNFGDKPFKNIIRPVLNIQYRTEGFDVKDIELFFIDEMVESYVDFGGALIKKMDDARPEVVKLQSIICDQTDILSGPIIIKHFFSPDELRKMGSNGWGNKKNGATVSIEELIQFAENVKDFDRTEGQKVITPGKYIEVYEVHGTFPANWLQDDGDNEEKKYIGQLHIVSCYRNDKDEKQWQTIFKGKEKTEDVFKLVLRDEIYGRALGLGGAEELFEPQLWTNYSEIRLHEMLHAASKVLYKTDDAAFAARNKIKDLDNEEIMVLAEGKDINQIDSIPRSFALFERKINEWEQMALQMGGANEALQGIQPPSGTPFKLQELLTIEGRGLHEYRRGKLAVFLDGIYQDWIIPHIAREISKDHIFLAELDWEELQMVSEKVMDNIARTFIVERILNGEMISEDEVALEKENARMQFLRGGRRKFIQIFADDFKDVSFSVRVNIVGKQKDLALKTDKLVNIFRQIVAALQMLDDPRIADLFNQILESSGFSPLEFGAERYRQAQPTQNPPQTLAPIEAFAEQPARAGMTVA